MGTLMVTWHHTSVGMSVFSSFFSAAKPNPLNLSVLTMSPAAMRLAVRWGLKPHAETAVSLFLSVIVPSAVVMCLLCSDFWRAVYMFSAGQLAFFGWPISKKMGRILLIWMFL